jgi:hypothetical protein
MLPALKLNLLKPGMPGWTNLEVFFLLKLIVTGNPGRDAAETSFDMLARARPKNQNKIFLSFLP